MRQGAIHYVKTRERSVGRFIRLGHTVERGCMIVSCTEYNESPDADYVWVLPTLSSSPAGLNIEGLTHTARDNVAEALPSPYTEAAVARVLEFLLWSLTGREPAPNLPDEVRRAHQQVIDAGGLGFAQGDVVVHDGVRYVIVSGLGHNTVPTRTATVLAVPVGPDLTVYPQRITSLRRERLARPTAEIPGGDLEKLIGNVRWFLVGGQEGRPDWLS